MALLLIHLASPIVEGIGRGDEPAMPHQASPQSDTDPLPTEGSPPNLRDQNATDARITELEKELHELRSQLQLQPAVEEPEEEEDGIEIGGAVRIQYSWEDYVQGNRERGGDVDFDIFRIDFDGELGVSCCQLSIGGFQYMDVVHHAWVGYRISDGWELQAGITRVPFGNLDFNSHNFFFSSCYYVGLEDDYDAGIKIVGKHEGAMIFVSPSSRQTRWGESTVSSITGPIGILTMSSGSALMARALSIRRLRHSRSTTASRCVTVSMRLGGIRRLWLAGDLRDR